jgi:transitional endoplasmic reticulum ATPase
VLDSLEGSLWYVLRHTNECKDEGIRCKRAILLHGDYGTGKSSAAYITAQIAEANGWGFIMANPGVDDINDVLKTARLYQPCVVFAEDIDNDANKVEQNEVSQLLESFDGLTSKSSEICLVMTTNHFETVHKGMLRPGRIDAVIEVGSLDRSGVETLVKAVVAPERLSEDIDYDQVYEAMVGFYPAFVREALERSKTYAIGRLAKEGNLVRGNIHYVLSTEDLVKAAHGLRPQRARSSPRSKARCGDCSRSRLSTLFTMPSWWTLTATPISTLRFRRLSTDPDVPALDGLGQVHRSQY